MNLAGFPLRVGPVGLLKPGAGPVCSNPARAGQADRRPSGRSAHPETAQAAPLMVHRLGRTGPGVFLVAS